MTLYEIIKAVQAAPKKGGHKQAILETYKDDELLQDYLKAVYDPRINYYMTKVPKVGSKLSAVDFDYMHLEKLEKLSSREVTGKSAKNFLEDLMSISDKYAQELIEYIIKRDIKADIGEGTILKVWPDLFFIPAYQRCSSMSDKIKEKFSKLPYWYVQTKNDGQFSYMIKRVKEAPVNMSRAGSIYPTWLSEKLAIGVPDGSVLAGEMLVYESGVMLNRQTGNGILNSILNGDGDKFNPETMEVKFVAWDMITVDEFDNSYSSREYEERLSELSSMLLQGTYAGETTPNISLVRNWKVTSITEAIKLQNEHLARKEEGTVWKAPSLLWRDCSSGDPLMVKAKLTFEADYKIVGMYEGEGKNTGKCGGFNVESSDGLIKFNVGVIKGSETQRDEFWKLGEEHFIGQIASIEGNDIVSSDGKDTESVFLPVLVEIRVDKKEADSRERVWEQFNAARGL